MRPVVMKDYKFVYEAYGAEGKYGDEFNWPFDEKGPFTLQRAIKSIQQWLRTDNNESCLILDTLGLITYRKNTTVVVVDNILVHPLHRGQGHGTTMAKFLFNKMISEGVVVGEFDALPGIYADKISSGQFEKVSEGKRSHGHGNSTGLPLITGRVTADTKL